MAVDQRGAGGAASAPALTRRAFRSARANLCPICGQGRLMRGWFEPEPECGRCGAEFTRYAAGDGAIFLVMLLLCFVAVGVAFAFEMLLSPPLWAHVGVAVVLVLGLTLALLPLTKRFMIAQAIVMGAAPDDPEAAAPPSRLRPR